MAVDSSKVDNDATTYLFRLLSFVPGTAKNGNARDRKGQGDRLLSPPTPILAGRVGKTR